MSASLAHEIDDESEAFPIAILFCAYVEFLWKPTRVKDSLRWPIAVGLAVVSWLVAWVLLTVSMPSSIATLNESFVAVGAMILYACLPRPLPWAPALTLVVLALMFVFGGSHFVVAQAESLVPIALMPIAFDWADRTILDSDCPRQPDAPRAVVRVPGSWCRWSLRFHVNIGSTHDVLHYPRRATEGFLGLLLIHLYFSYWQGNRWRDRAWAPEVQRDRQPV